MPPIRPDVQIDDPPGSYPQIAINSAVNVLFRLAGQSVHKALATLANVIEIEVVFWVPSVQKEHGVFDSGGMNKPTGIATYHGTPSSQQAPRTPRHRSRIISLFLGVRFAM